MEKNIADIAESTEPAREQILTGWNNFMKEYSIYRMERRKECEERGHHMYVFGPMVYHSKLDKTSQQRLCVDCGHLEETAAQGNILGDPFRNL